MTHLESDVKRTDLEPGLQEWPVRSQTLNDRVESAIMTKGGSHAQQH